MMTKSSRKSLSDFSLRNQQNGVQREIPLGSIVLPDYQPRQYFDLVKLEELTESIKKHGILEPLLVVFLSDEKYELIAGGRRYQAALKAGLISVPVVVLDLNEQEALEIAILENLQREDLNPYEETESILRLMSLKLEIPLNDVPSLLYSMQQQRKGKSTHNVMGKDKFELIETLLKGLMTFESFVNNRLPILNLPNDILDVLKKGKIEYTKAKAIASVNDEVFREQLLTETIEQSLSLSQIREKIKTNQPSIIQENLRERFNDSLKRVKNSKALWSDPKKRKKIEKLIAQIEALVEEKTKTDEHITYSESETTL